ncbi:hypothetical protein E8E12_003213 [Didymella heteroderae]|uniref:Phosphoglycerate mutase-like protein n=1 Tax=Didymella heteroderae TaxID=1769908 RepID=A0A9P5BWP9_9PLEO|nr:hypothetical protein E8E12_003213 [Didymella heteroderae]
MIASSLLYGLLAAASLTDAASQKKQIKYEVVTGIFQQDDNATDPNTFNFLTSNFGLINRTYPSDPKTPDSKYSTQWQRLNKYIKTLNKEKKTRYSLLFLGRHGEGFHNAAETYFGTPAWNCYWSELDGNGTVTWADAKLTPNGIKQTQDVNTFWSHLIADEKITPPESYYTSPLYRCLDTARLTFGSLDLPKKSPFVPTVKELLREGISAHTCDRRSDKTYIHQNFPSYKFEKGFTEHDPYWKALMAEPSADQDIRSKAVLDDIFSNDDSTYISITSHSGEIGSLLRVLGHRVFKLATGAAIPVLVKQTTVTADGPATTTVPWNSQATCATPPRGVAFMYNNVNPSIEAAVFVDDPTIVRLFCQSMAAGDIVKFQKAIQLGNVFQNVQGDEKAAQFFSEYYQTQSKFLVEGFKPLPFEYEAAEGETLEAEIAALGDELLEFLFLGALGADAEQLVLERHDWPTKPDVVLQKSAEAAAQRLGLEALTPPAAEDLMKMLTTSSTASDSADLPQANAAVTMWANGGNSAAYGLTFTFWRKAGDKTSNCVLKKWDTDGVTPSFRHIVTAPPQCPFTLVPMEGQTLSWYNSLFFGQQCERGYVVLSLPGGSCAIDIRVPPRVGGVGYGPYYQVWDSGDENALPSANFKSDDWKVPVDIPGKPYTFLRSFGGYQVKIAAQATGETLMLSIDVQ